MKIKESDWVEEVEAKWDKVSLTILKRGLRILERKGALITPLFSGLVRTSWFNHGLEKGTSARVRVARTADGLEPRITATIKKTMPHERRGRVLHVKTKLEWNHPVDSLEDGYEVLVESTRSLGLIRPQSDLVNDFIATKERTSFGVNCPDEPYLQTDADRPVSFNPKPTRYDDEWNVRGNLHFTELEAVDHATAQEKETRFLLKGAEMEFPPINPVFAPLNTRRYHKEKGEY